ASAQDRVSAQINNLIDAFKIERASWVARAGESEWHLARQSAELLAQFVRMASAKDEKEGYSARDLAMANTVRALLEAGGSDAKALLWAHNGHAKGSAGYEFSFASFDGKTMGSFLHTMFGAEHVAIGFAFNQGAFRVAIDYAHNMGSREVGPAPA